MVLWLANETSRLVRDLLDALAARAEPAT